MAEAAPWPTASPLAWWLTSYRQNSVWSDGKPVAGKEG